MARGLWTGAISFGLINIPVQIMSAKEQERLHFHMLDKHDFAPIGYKQINKKTGREVQRKNIVKGYEYSPNQFVVITDADFEKANPKATQTLDIQDFVNMHDVDPLLFEKPYYLVPGKSGEKGYLLLRKTLERTKKGAVTQFVMRKKEYLGVIMARGDYLVLEILRYAHEIKEISEAKFLEGIDMSKVRISERELKMAEDLVKGMTERWQPKRYKDTYQNDLLRRIEAKIKGGDTETVEDEESIEPTNTNSVDLGALLAKSLKNRKRGHAASSQNDSDDDVDKTPMRTAAARKSSAVARKTVKAKAKKLASKKPTAKKKTAKRAR